MIKINDLEIDFDLTSPTDIQRYTIAGEKMENDAKGMNLVILPSNDPNFLKSYMDFLDAELKIFGNFIDGTFGDGIADKLLGNNPSLNKVTEINEAIGDALEEQGKKFGVKLQKYKPNRTTRRTQ